MADIEVEGPDGAVISFPEGTSHDVMSAALQKHYGSSPSQPSTTEDVAKSGATGVLKGAIGLATAPVSIESGLHALADHGINPVLDKLFGPSQAKPSEAGSLHDIATNPDRYAGPSALTKDADKAGLVHTPQTTAGKYAETVGEFAPSAAIGSPTGLLGRLATQAVVPGVASEAAGEATKGSAAEPWARGVAALASPLALSAARRVVTPLPISPERQGFVDLLRNEGVDLTAGQTTGSKPLRWMESALGDTPGTGGMAERMDESQRRQFTAAAMRRVGSNADNALPESVAPARQAIQQQFQDLSARNTMRYDQQFGNDLGQAINGYDYRTLPTFQRDVIGDIMGDIAQQPNGQMPGQLYQSTRSTLSRMSNQSRQSDPSFSTVIRGLRDALDGAMNRSITPEDAQAWGTARQQWANMKVIEKAATGAGENAAQGMISPSALRNATVGQNRTAYATGHGDFADLARAGEAVIKPLPNSGTAPRRHISELSHAFGAAAGAILGGAPGAAAGVIAPAVLGPLAGRALLSRPAQAYLSNQLLTGPAGRRGLLAQLPIASGVATRLLTSGGQ